MLKKDLIITRRTQKKEDTAAVVPCHAIKSADKDWHTCFCIRHARYVWLLARVIVNNRQVCRPWASLLAWYGTIRHRETRLRRCDHVVIWHRNSTDLSWWICKSDMRHKITSCIAYGYHRRMFMVELIPRNVWIINKTMGWIKNMDDIIISW